MGWSWLIITLIIQFYASFSRPQTYGRGKYLTMPLRKKFPKIFNNGWCRSIQIFNVFFVTFALGTAWNSNAYIFYWLTIIALSVDDYFTDDEDKKRFKEWARNKFKWKMELPKPIRVKGTV